ncbi:MAG TPA: ribosome silencing factor [Nitrospinota bacterium]|nr:ribosome silencing factor [Nitrospinota bacterium]|tara:strand:- start:113886 stop:114254 length:369 start_codon:yes stop_codon:yes gene_type:complete
MNTDPTEKAIICYNSALSKKAKDVVILDARNVSDITSFLLIANGTSTTHVKTVVDSIESDLRSAGQKRYHIEGYQNAWWALIDAGDIICHIFIDEARKYYDLDRHWRDATIITPNYAVSSEV